MMLTVMNDTPQRGNATMENPATITDRIRDRGEALMSLASDLQSSARQITKMLGRAETIYRRASPTFAHGAARDRVAREVRACRQWLRDRGYDAAAVCAEFRDPDAFAFCDGGGATAQDFR
jgi:hypothetical protein